jgi:hypothetical protein
MKNRSTILRYFRCPECAGKMTAPKMSADSTGSGHIKTMWCWRCKTERDFVQIDAEIIRKKRR